MENLKKDLSVNHFINAGIDGFLPLFYQEWIKESYEDHKELRKLSFSRAAENVNKMYKKFSQHKSVERKKTALTALSPKERKKFILSFMKLVEYRTLDKFRELH